MRGDSLLRTTSISSFSSYPIARAPSVGGRVRRSESLPTIGGLAEYVPPAVHKPYGSWKNRRTWDIYEYGSWTRYYNVTPRGWNTYSTYTYAPYKRMYAWLEPLYREYKHIYNTQYYPAMYLYTPYRKYKGPPDYADPVFYHRYSDIYMDRPAVWHRPYRSSLYEAKSVDQAMDRYKTGSISFNSFDKFWLSSASYDRRLQHLKEMYTH